MSSPMSILDIDDLSAEQFNEVLRFASLAKFDPVLAGKSVALYFEKPSARTRNSAEVAIRALGGGVTTISDTEVGLGVRESVSDVGRTLGCYHDLIGARVKNHSVLEELKSVSHLSGVGVINLLSDVSHPTQAVADVITITDSISANPKSGRTKVVYVGDSNNVTRSLAKACSYADFDTVIASPEGYNFSEEELATLRIGSGSVEWVADLKMACEGADFIYTDVWVSMGQEADGARKLVELEPYRVTADLMALGSDRVKFMHCLPAHRGLEVEATVIDGESSLVWQQARARMTAFVGILGLMFGGLGEG